MTDRPVPTGELPVLESSHALEAVPGYTLVRLLGEGTIARAYECRHDRTNDIVILKVINAEAAADRGATQRTLRENRVVSGLRAHPHIARVIDVGEAGAGPYVAFEKLKGTDLRSVLVQSGRLPVADALAAVRDAARALDAAAAVGVAHRDVKPSNLFRLDQPGAGEGSVKLTDFGFAPPLSKVGGPVGVYGTPAFIAPELLRGSPADVRTDIYALGATLFQLVTARPLFEGTTADVLAAHQKKPVPSIATMVPDAGLAIVDVIYRLLNKDPAKRPQTAAEVVALLESAMGKKRTTSSMAMPAVGAPSSSSSPPQAARGPSPSEPQWATMDSAKLPRPPSRGQMAGVGGGGGFGGVAQNVSSPFDAPGDDANPYMGQPTGVLGTLKQMGVTDILQMLEIGKKSARLEVQIDGGNAVIQVHDGQIVFARLARPQGGPVISEGEAAVITLCRKKDGFFRIHYEKENTEKNVNKPTQFVLLEAMRQIDEKAEEARQAAPAANAANNAANAANARGADLDDPVVSDVRVLGASHAPRPPSSPPAHRPQPAPGVVPPVAQPNAQPPRQPLPHLATPLARPGVGAPASTSPAQMQMPASTWPEPPAARHERSRDPTQSGSAPRPVPMPAIGDGIQRDDSTQAVETIDDPTMPEAPTAKGSRGNRAAGGGGAGIDIARLQARAMALAKHALDVGNGLWHRAAHALEPLRPRLVRIHPSLESVPPIAVVGGAAALLLVVLIALASALSGGGSSMTYADGVDAIFDGDAADVVDALEDIKPADRTLDQDLVLGHAHAALLQDERALELYRIALPLRADPIALGVLTSRLDASAPDEEIDLLVLWPDGDADERLADLTLDPRPLVRMNAAAILVERGTAGLVDVEQTALLDFVQARSCGERRIALATLRAAGKSQPVLDAVGRVGRANESCFGGNELSRAYAAIQKRLE